MFTSYNNLKKAVDLWYSNKKYALKLYDHISKWNTKKIKNMDGLFYNFEEFNEDLNNWDVSNVKSMSHMFYNCRMFNKDISSWNIGKVKDISYMFYNCSKFNKSLDKWNTGHIEEMNYAFYNCIKLDKPINNWDFSNITIYDSFYEHLKFMLFNTKINTTTIFEKWNKNFKLNIKKTESFEDLLYKAFEHLIMKNGIIFEDNSIVKFIKNKDKNKYCKPYKLLISSSENNKVFKEYDRTSDILINRESSSKLFWRLDNAFPMPKYIPINEKTIDYWYNIGDSIYPHQLSWFEKNCCCIEDESFMDRTFG